MFQGVMIIKFKKQQQEVTQYTFDMRHYNFDIKQQIPNYKRIWEKQY